MRGWRRGCGRALTWVDGAFLTVISGGFLLECALLRHLAQTTYNPYSTCRADRWGMGVDGVGIKQAVLPLCASLSNPSRAKISPEELAILDYRCLLESELAT